MHSIVPVQEEHILELALTMQDIDKQSVLALSGYSPERGLRSSIKNSEETFTWLVGNKVGAIYGVKRPHPLSDWASAWMLASDELVKHPKRFMEGSRDWVRDVVEEYGWLKNYVYAEHHRSIRWLKWLGFTLYPPEPIGKNGEMFHLNELKRG